jgi:hypothetical protein
MIFSRVSSTIRFQSEAVGSAGEICPTGTSTMTESFPSGAALFAEGAISGIQGREARLYLRGIVSRRHIDVEGRLVRDLVLSED